MSSIDTSSHGGLCFIKLLVSNGVAGSIIGKNGREVAALEAESGATVKLSSTKQFYPGTDERVVVVSGEREQVESAIVLLHEKIRDNGDERLGVRVVLPRVSVSGIIGKGGGRVRNLQECTGTKIRISPRDEGFIERTLTITGPWDNVQSAALKIFDYTRSDPNLKDFAYVSYQFPMTYPPYCPIPQPNNDIALDPSQHAWPPSPHMNSMNNYKRSNLFLPQKHPYTDDSSQICEISFPIPNDCVGRIVGKSGAGITQLMKITKTKIRVSPKESVDRQTGNRVASVTGPVFGVHHAHTAILHKIRLSKQELIHLPQQAKNESQLPLGIQD